jgi:hypothetical protein
MNGPGKRFTKDNDLVTRDVAGETIIVPIKGRVGDLDAIYTLNEVGTFIWQHLESRPTILQLVDAVAREYDVEPAEAMRDVMEFLESLEAAGLIRRG